MTEARRRALLERRLAQRGLAAAADRQGRIPRRADPARAPLSAAQLQAWRYQRQRPHSVSNNLCLVLTFSGPLDEQALARAFTDLARRHEILRTTYHTGPAGRPYQRIHPNLPPRTRRVDLRGSGPEEFDRFVRRAAAEPFDLAAEGPLRLTYARLGAEELAVVLVIQHIAWDGATFGVLSAELSSLYRQEVLAPLPMQYGDFAEWEHSQWRQPGHGAREQAHWRDRLSPPQRGTYLPWDRSPPERAGEDGGRVDRMVPNPAAEGLRGLADRCRTTPFTAFLACWAALLHRESGAEEVIVGTTVACRDQPGTEGLIGNFGNTVVLRLDASGDPPFAELLARAGAECEAAFSHQDYPYERLADELGARRPSGAPAFFDSLLVFIAQQTEGPRLPGITTRWERVDTGAVQFPLIPLGVEVFTRPGGLDVQATYSRDIFDPGTVQRLLTCLETAITRAAANPGARLSALVPRGENRDHR